MFLIFVVVLTAIFMVLEATSYPDRLRHGLGVSNTVIDQYRSFAKSVNSYLLTRVKLNLALAVPVTILLFVLGVDFPIFWGVVTFFVGFIPVIGFLLAVAPPTALALIESGWVYAVIVIAGYTIINGVVDNVLQVTRRRFLIAVFMVLFVGRNRHVACHAFNSVDGYPF